MTATRAHAKGASPRPTRPRTAAPRRACATAVRHRLYGINNDPAALCSAVRGHRGERGSCSHQTSVARTGNDFLVHQSVALAIFGPPACACASDMAATRGHGRGTRPHSHGDARAATRRCGGRPSARRGRARPLVPLRRRRRQALAAQRRARRGIDGARVRGRRARPLRARGRARRRAARAAAPRRPPSAADAPCSAAARAARAVGGALGTRGTISG